ncbi:hypothetical protein L1987_83742 [Smallanthus sonchifolius]|uniref:Uncharacterized protein n=1 Tax=Smallanthus sonchifolius TaxID=185202 RepID=A0ACB8YDX5_9ASTR|nr:hypothetical protein L1987_83742 [Smallanthus sonchifolius]
MEQGKASASKPYHQVWSKLDEQGVSGEGPDMESLEDDFKSLLIVPSNSEYSDVELRSDEVEIDSDVLVSSFEKQGWCEITRNSDLSSTTLRNKSLNVNFADGTDAPTEDTIISGPVSDGIEIYTSFVFNYILEKMDSDYKSIGKGYLSYRFKMMPMNESSKNVFKISLDSEHVKCSICLNIWLDVVTVAPCLHNFCNGCLLGWLRRSQENHTTVVCPDCKSCVQSVGRNRFLRRIEEEIRQSEEFAVVNSDSLIKSLPVINYRKKPRSKRSRSMPEEDITCAQCDTEYGGFQCNRKTVHMQCHACGGLMPYRTDIPEPQRCIGCDYAFCGAYWHSLQIGERSISRIPLRAHGRNRHEQDITKRCIQQMGKTLQDVVSEWVTKLNNREIDRTRMLLNHAEMITSGTHVCNCCHDKVVSFLLYWFRICLPKGHLPEDAAQREDCWYGYTCRTQHHNGDHARNRNHVCPPTKGGLGN